MPPKTSPIAKTSIGFKPLFERAEREVQSGVRKGVRIGQEAGVDAGVNVGDFFVLGGQMVYVAEKGEETKTPRHS